MTPKRIALARSVKGANNFIEIGELPLTELGTYYDTGASPAGPLEPFLEYEYTLNLEY